MLLAIGNFLESVHRSKRVEENPSQKVDVDVQSFLGCKMHRIIFGLLCLVVFLAGQLHQCNGVDPYMHHHPPDIDPIHHPDHHGDHDDHHHPKKR